jgi:hypothetical protein
MLFFLKPLLEARDASQVETICYSTTAKPDAHTRGFHAVADVWRDVRALNAAGVESVPSNEVSGTTP